MKNKIITLAIATVLTIVSCSVVVNYYGSNDLIAEKVLDNSTLDQVSISSVSGIEITNTSKPYNIIVLGDLNSATSIKNAISSKPAMALNQNISSKTNLVFMTENWSQQNQNIVTDTIDSVVKSGFTIAILDKDIDWDSLDVSTIREKNAVITCVRTTENGYSFYNVTCEDQDVAIQKTLDWMDSEVNSVASDIPRGEIGSEYLSKSDFESVTYGWTSVRTTYYKLVDTNTTRDYYAGHYFVSMQPNEGSYNSGLDVKSDSNGNILQYGPHTTSDESTYSVNLEVNSGLLGTTFTAGASWSYTLPDIVVRDYTSVVNSILDVRHDISEDKMVGYTTCTVEPGQLVYVEEGEGYYSTDTYKVQYCHHHGIFGYWQYDDRSVELIVAID